jgi:hypothetical protein
MIKTFADIEQAFKFGIKPNEVAFISNRTREIGESLLAEINKGKDTDKNVGLLMSLLKEIKIGVKNGR